MSEQRQIVERWQQGSALILATLVRVQGSSYRRPGARLMICENGAYEGGISGGCLEADLLRKAAWLVHDGPVVERYSTQFDEAGDMPFGLGCGGVLDVLLESVETIECQALMRAIESSLQGREHLIATWLPNKDRDLMRAVFSADGERIFSSNGLSCESLSNARKACLLHRHEECDGTFVELLVPPQRLFVFGAGNDARPLVTMASLLGWSVTVVDGRTHLARKARFPESHVEVESNSAAAIEKIDSRDAVVIMTHSYAQDRAYLQAVLPLRPQYLGLLGSRQRSSLLIADAAAALAMSVSECCEHISAPVGLDIGGEGPDAIALAIIAEAQACCMGKRNESRNLSAEHVEKYLATIDAERYTQMQCRLDLV